jgi:hypothetical protein
VALTVVFVAKELWPRLRATRSDERCLYLRRQVAQVVAALATFDQLVGQ